MANTKSAAKRARQTGRRTLANKRVVSGVKSQLKKVRTLMGEGKQEAARAEFAKLSSALDKAVKGGRIHRNAAARHKSQLNRRLAASQAAS